VIDIFDIMDTPGANVQIFTVSGSSNNELKVWQKPRGAKLIAMFALGAGSSGGCGVNTGTTSGGGGGGGSGSQSSLLIPAIFVPDNLLIMIPAGGKQPAALVSGAAQALPSGGSTFVYLEHPATFFSNYDAFLQATNPTASVAAANTTAGGVAGAAAGAASITNMILAGKGFYNLLPGQAGGSGNTATAGTLTIPQTGLLAMGGSGGGGASATPGPGGNTVLGSASLASYWTRPGNSTDQQPGGRAASGATPADSGVSGAKCFSSTTNRTITNIMNLGGTGGGGASTTAGGNAGAGGGGSYGSGGGGAGGSTTTNATLARPGDGGDGLVVIVSF
jgi:hypothetical protein